MQDRHPKRLRPPKVIFHALALALLSPSLALAACGGSVAPTAPTDVVVTPNFSTHHNDRDNDGDHNDDDGKVLGYGHAATAADWAASTALVKNYFAAAAAGDGLAGCHMLFPLVAETVAEEDGHSTQLRGKTCATVLSKLFGLRHRELVEKRTTLKIIEVRAEGTKELVVLDFPRIPEVRQITARRVGSTWKLMDLLDGILE